MQMLLLSRWQVTALFLVCRSKEKIEEPKDRFNFYSNSAISLIGEAVLPGAAICSDFPVNLTQPSIAAAMSARMASGNEGIAPDLDATQAPQRLPASFSVARLAPRNM